jgi:uncharacterized protein YjbI with pentapeptide repeats/uncharacterized NAD(P)/FAD-binding protein YdhS
LIYGQYLASRFTKAKAAANPSISVTEMDLTCLRVEERAAEIRVLCQEAGGGERQISSDRVVIATGHDRPIVPAFLTAHRPHQDIFDSPYSKSFAARCSRLHSTQTVLILGTGLTAYDAVLTLRANDFKGTIVMVSRHGFTHNAYPGNHIHDILPLPLPPLPDRQLSAEEMLATLEAQIERGTTLLHMIQPNISSDVVEERVFKALEPWTAEWIHRSDSQQVQRFLDEAKSRITTRRTGVVPEVNSVIRELKHSAPQLRQIGGSIHRVSISHNEITVIVKHSADAMEETIAPALIVSCLGSNSDYSNTEHPVWKDLIASGAAAVHEKTRRGVCVDEFGALVRLDGSVSDRVFAVGPMRQGDEIERNGRLGAFVFSVGTLRNQALLAATRVLWLAANPQYGNLDRHTRRKVDAACQELIKQGNPEATKSLIRAILAIRLADVAAHLPAGDEQSLQEIEAWLKRHLHGVTGNTAGKTDRIGAIASQLDADRSLVEHAFWYHAQFEAALEATDIRRLPSDYHRVRCYKTRTSTEFLEERLACSALLRASAFVFGAKAGSMLIYDYDKKTLYPFAMYRRVEKFTPTAVGKGVAGALVKAFIEGDRTPAKGIDLYIEGDWVIGASVSDYNELQREHKKENYLARARSFPSILLALLAVEQRLLGVVYLEAPERSRYECRDVRLLAALFSSKRDMMKSAQTEWCREFNLSYRFGDFEDAFLASIQLGGRDLSKAVFRNAKLEGAVLNGAILNGTNFDRADLRQARMQRATVVGASFVDANLSGAWLDGAAISHTDFRGSDLSHCRFSGTVIQHSSFSQANLSRVWLRETDISSLRFDNAVLRNCTLTGLDGVSSADWSGVDLAGSRLDRSVWTSLPSFVRRIHEGRVWIDDHGLS